MHGPPDTRKAPPDQKRRPRKVSISSIDQNGNPTSPTLQARRARFARGLARDAFPRQWDGVDKSLADVMHARERAAARFLSGSRWLTPVGAT